jgi:hypothetical protein
MAGTRCKHPVLCGENLTCTTCGATAFELIAESQAAERIVTQFERIILLKVLRGIVR